MAETTPLDDPWETAPPEGAGAPSTLDATTSPASSARILPQIEGYEILEVLGEGGMGIVYKARQVALDRLVALKTIRGSAAGVEEQQRFHTEAEAAAKLRHPGIVQIYEVSKQGGLLYFSMELVEGGNLDALLRHGPLPPATAARLVEMAAEAIGAAHEQRIIHRDLKPANVLLSAACGLARNDSNLPAKPQAAEFMPKITDFGLAKRLDEVGLSVTGQILGTPSYMAPEQAKGLVHQIGPTADVYALGAILYECLTGRPPFQAASVADTLMLLLTEEPAPVRRLQPRVPRDLETICHKCLHKEPQKRYASAAELADDLRRFHEGRSILARPVGTLEHTYRWYRRHPALSWLSMIVAVLVVTVAVVSSVSYFKVSGVNAALRDANTNLERERQRAEDNADQARKGYALASRSMEQTVFRIAQDPFLKDRGFFELRKQLLAPAAKFYSELVELKSNDPALEADRGRGYGQLAEVRAMLGETEQAAADYLAMGDLFSALVKAYPNEPAYKLALSRANRGQGQMLRDLARYGEADTALIRASALADELATRYPDQAKYLDERIAVEFWRGVNALTAARWEEARKTFVRTLDMQDKRERRFPPTRTTRDARAGMHTNLARACQELKQYPDALRHYQACLDIRKQLTAEAPASSEYLFALASSWQNMGVAYHYLRRQADEENALRETNRLAQLLVKRFPTLPASRGLLAHSCHNLAFELVHHKRYAEADRLYDEATAILESMVAEFPGVPRYKQELGMHYTNRGSHVFTRNPYQGLSWGDKAVRVLTDGLAADPRDPLMREWLANAHKLRSTSLSHLDRWDEAVRAMDRAVAVNSALEKDGKFKLDRWLLTRRAYIPLGPAHKQAEAGKHVEAARMTNIVVEGRLLGSMHAFAGTHVLTSINALAVARELAEREGPLPTNLFNAACVLALCAGAALKEDSLLVESYAERAMLFLSRARDEGYFAGMEGIKQLDTDSDLASLRQREDFREFRAALRRHAKGR